MQAATNNATNNTSDIRAAGMPHSSDTIRAAEKNNPNPSVISTERFLKSLQELASDEIKNKPVLLRQAIAANPPNLNVVFGLREAYRKQIFSPDLDRKVWQEQLAMLKKYDARVAGISFTQFDRVDVMNLASIEPNHAYRLIGRKPNELVVLYGECVRKGMQLGISKGVTVIGSGAKIAVGEQSFQLGIPEAVIVADAQSSWPGKTWKIGYRKDDAHEKPVILTDTLRFGVRCGPFPLVYTDHSNVIGLTLNCSYTTQGIAGTGVNLFICNNKIINLPGSGIFLHNCSVVSICSNEFSTKKADTPIGINTANCLMCIQEKNLVRSV